MKILTVVEVLLAAILMFFGIIFLIASVYESTRIITGSIFVLTSFLIILYVYKTRPQPPKRYQVELPSEVKTKTLKCPNCSASISMENVRVVTGLTYADCPYCGHHFQLTEEPKW